MPKSSQQLFMGGQIITIGYKYPGRRLRTIKGQELKLHPSLCLLILVFNNMDCDDDDTDDYDKDDSEDFKCFSFPMLVQPLPPLAVPS